MKIIHVSRSVYEEFLTAVLDVCLGRNLRPNPTTVVADFEIGIHNAVRSVLGQDIHIQGCFYHLTQSTWRRLQADGLQAAYREDDAVRTFIGMLDGLAFLPVDRVTEGMAVLREEAPEELNSVVDYFDNTYVSGSFRCVASDGVMRFRRTPPRFPPHVWNVHEVTLSDNHRTNNICESWNNGFKHLVGSANPSLWTVITSLKKDLAHTETENLQYQHGIQPNKRRRTKNINHQNRMKMLCSQVVEGKKSVKEFLVAVGQCIRLK